MWLFSWFFEIYQYFIENKIINYIFLFSKSRRFGSFINSFFLCMGKAGFWPKNHPLSCFQYFRGKPNSPHPLPVLSLSLSLEREREISDQFQLWRWYVSHKSKKYDTPDSSVNEYFRKKNKFEKEIFYVILSCLSFIIIFTS